MKYFLIALTFISNTGHAQTGEDSIKMVINKMFAAMKNADTLLLKDCFADSMILQSLSVNKEGTVVVRNESSREFINFIGKELPGNADERISYETIKIDGPLAIAWTPYQFYYKGQLSHCGVNSFQLVRYNGSWKIQYIIDTRRKQQCI
ncbi:MAG: hypothetical protein ABIU11_04795 [Chitinophagaceae bacterium]